MWALLKTRRWIAFTVLVIAAIVGFGLLSHWQWQRADERRLERTDLATELARTPVTLESALVTPREWTPVVVSGTYRSDLTVLVRQRPLSGANGFWVATPLVTQDGTTVWINRGWIAATGTATQVQQPPAPPEGTVTVNGRLRLAEATPNPPPADLPAGQVAALDPVYLGAGYPGAYIEAATSSPADSALTPIPVPEVDEGRNISYAVQWLLFAVIAVAGWFYFLRREAREDEARQEAPWTSA